MTYYKTSGDLCNDWCGVTSDEQEAVSAALEGREEDLFKLDVYKVEDAALALEWCHKEHCRNHDDPDARRLIESVLRRREL